MYIREEKYANFIKDPKIFLEIGENPLNFIHPFNKLKYIREEKFVNFFKSNPHNCLKVGNNPLNCCSISIVITKQASISKSIN